MRELLIEIWTSVRRNKLRTFLTGFSVAWGIFMLVILLGSGNGLKNGVTSQFGDYAINSIDLFGGWTSKPYKGYEKDRRIILRNGDIDILVKEFPEVQEVAACSWYESGTVSYGNGFMKTYLRGSLPQIEHIKGINVIEGRFINDADIANNRKVIVIDQAMQRVLFKDKSSPLGCNIKVGNSVFTIVGITKGDANRSEASSEIPLTTGQLIYKGNNTEVGNVTFTIENITTGTEMEAFEKRMLGRLAAEHQFDPTDESAIYLENNMETFQKMSMVFNGINIFVWIIGLGTLLAGIVGVSNIMLVTVTERTSEFGIRKALGAKPSSIIRLILTESVLVTALFGYIGMVLGVAVMEVVNLVLEQMPADDSQFGGSIFLNPTLDLSVAVSATVVLVVAGLVAGYIPAYRAAQLKTIDALRHNK